MFDSAARLVTGFRRLHFMVPQSLHSGWAIQEQVVERGELLSGHIQTSRSRFTKPFGGGWNFLEMLVFCPEGVFNFPTLPPYLHPPTHPNPRTWDLLRPLPLWGILGVSPSAHECCTEATWSRSRVLCQFPWLRQASEPSGPSPPAVCSTAPSIGGVR